jgi:hypothetical protein
MNKHDITIKVLYFIHKYIILNQNKCYHRDFYF